MQAQGVGLLMLVNPISLRYAAEYRTYGLFQAHIPTTYLLMPAEGPASLFSACSQTSSVRDFRPGRPIHHFDGGDWHDGRMLASGERINPWLQEASQRVVQDGDLVGFDTDMVGPMGYFADISRTLHCGPSKPTRAQKALYREAVAEVQHNMALIRPGVTLNQFRERARAMDERFHAQAYTCMLHAVGMCDEYPQIKHPWQEQPYDCEFEAGMVLCVESYCGEVGGRDGVKLEQQVLVTEDGIELLSDYPWDARLMD